MQIFQLFMLKKKRILGKSWAEKSFLQFLLLPPRSFPFLLSPVSYLLLKDFFSKPIINN